MKRNNHENMALLFATEFLSSLLINFSSFYSEIKELGVKFNLGIVTGEFIYGFLGSNKISQFYYNRNVEILSKIIEKEKFTEPAIILDTDVYNKLHLDLQVLCFPYDITDENIFYKVYCPELQIEVKSNNIDNENKLFDEEFNLNAMYKMKQKIKTTIFIDLEVLLDNYYNSNHIPININSTIKSLTKLAFHFILIKKYDKVFEILKDICVLLEEEETLDKDYYFKIKQLKDQIQQEVHKK